MTKQRFALAGVAAALGALALAATVAAAGPGNGQAAGQAAADALGLTREQVTEMRQEGLSLAQIAEKQGVSVSRVVDAVASQFMERIQERVKNGALTDAEATALQEQVRERAQAMVQQTELGGMQGAAVGAGTGMGHGPYGTGDGIGVCDGTGQHGAGRP